MVDKVIMKSVQINMMFRPSSTAGEPAAGGFT